MTTRCQVTHLPSHLHHVGLLHVASCDPALDAVAEGPRELWDHKLRCACLCCLCDTYSSRAPLRGFRCSSVWRAIGGLQRDALPLSLAANGCGRTLKLKAHHSRWGITVPGADRARLDAILDRSAVNLQKRRSAWQQTGWNSYDASAAPFSAEQVRKERSLYGNR